MVSRIYLIRHGLTEGNLKHWYYGSTDIPLTDEGYDTIKSYAAQGIYPDIPDDADIYTTGLIRTEQTLEAIYGDREHSTLPKLQEIDFRSAECMTYDELKKFDNFDAWAWDTSGDVRIADAETSNEFHERIHDGTDELLGKHQLREWAHRHGGDDAISVLVCHGGVISCIMEYLFPSVCGSMWDWLPDPGFGYAIDLEDGKPYMYSKINDIGRLGLGIYKLPNDAGDILHSDKNDREAALSSIPSGANALSDMIEPYLAGGHGYFELYFNKDTTVHGDSEDQKKNSAANSEITAEKDPAAFSASIKSALIDRHPRASYKLACSIDIGDVDELEQHLSDTGAGYFDRVCLWNAERYYVGEDASNDVIREAFGKLDALKKSGKASKIGLGFFGDPDILDRLLQEQTVIDYVELPVNYQSGYGNGERSQKYYTISRRRYKEIIVTGPFDGGRLARELPEGAVASKEIEGSIAGNSSGSVQNTDSMARYAMMKDEQAPRTPVEWALRYVLSLPFVTVCIASTSEPEHAVENIEAANSFRPLTEDQQELLKKAACAHRTPEYEDIKALFEEAENREVAEGMEHYMRDMFTFYGIKTPDRRKIYRDFLNKEKKRGSINWAFLDDCYSDLHREFQYLACDYLLTMKDALAFDDLEHIRRYIETRPWWDTIDFLCKAVGDVGLRDSRVDDLMLEWAEDDDMWIRRTAIEHQLGRKNDTDKRLLSRIIKKNLGSKEFFINKAIGWALRDYSKTDPKWVRRFVDKNCGKLSPLSIREGSKYI